MERPPDGDVAGLAEGDHGACRHPALTHDQLACQACVEWDDMRTPRLDEAGIDAERPHRTIGHTDRHRNRALDAARDALRQLGIQHDVALPLRHHEDVESAEAASEGGMKHNLASWPTGELTVDRQVAPLLTDVESSEGADRTTLAEVRRDGNLA